MFIGRHRYACVFLLATAWTVIGTFFITASVFVQQMEQNTHSHTHTASGQHVLHTPSMINGKHSASTVVGETGDEEDNNHFDLNFGNNEEDDFISDQYLPGEEIDESINDQDLPENDYDYYDHDDYDYHSDDHESSPEMPVPPEFQEKDVDTFCDAFDKHYEARYPDLVLSLSDNGDSFQSLVKKLGSRIKGGLRLLLPLIETRGRASWLLFHHEISQYALYDPESPTVSRLLEDIATKPVKSFENFDKGTQVKLLLTLEDGAIVLLKPMRFPREQETFPNHFYFNDFERHIAEIAAFHLDRVMGFYRVPPTVGRVFSIDNDFKWFINSSFEENVYMSPAGNTCFYTECDMYCDSNHPICGSPDLFEASIQILLPGKGKAKHEDELHPWSRSYSVSMLAPWEHNDGYCEMIRKDKPYNDGRRLLDLMDVAVFDFFMGNMDRHDIDLFMRFGTDTAPILFDNGRGFGKSKEDIVSILAPIAQCCQIRLSTLAKLIKLYRGSEKLSSMMRTSLEADPLESVLTEPHLEAFDRRVVAILKVVQGCVNRKGDFDKVVIDDGH